MEELLGSETNNLYRGIATVVIALMATGTVFVFSAGVDIGGHIELGQFYNYPQMRQMLYFPVAVLVMFGFSRVDYRRLGFGRGLWRSPLLYMMGLSVILMIMVLIPRFGTEVNYARRWLRWSAGPVTVSFQPSELAKWVMVFFAAAYCDRYAGQLGQFFRRFVPICVVAAVMTGLTLVEDFGTAALMSLMTFLMLLVAGARLRYLFAPAPFAAAAFAAAIITSEARKQRILAFLHPDKWTDTINYQPSQSLIALGSGKIFGKGLGQGMCKYGHLPEDTTDFVFAIIGEELGLVGTVGVIALFMIFTWLGILVVIRCRDRFGQLLAGGVVMAIAIQAALNIGVVTVVLPTKGIPLPFVSSGGTSMLLSAAAVGVLLSIASRCRKETEAEELVFHKSLFAELEDGGE